MSTSAKAAVIVEEIHSTDPAIARTDELLAANPVIFRERPQKPMEDDSRAPASGGVSQQQRVVLAALPGASNAAQQFQRHVNGKSSLQQQLQAQRARLDEATNKPAADAEAEVYARLVPPPPPAATVSLREPLLMAAGLVLFAGSVYAVYRLGKWAFNSDAPAKLSTQNWDADRLAQLDEFFRKQGALGPHS